jgi:hypothetical protein
LPAGAPRLRLMPVMMAQLIPVYTRVWITVITTHSEMPYMYYVILGYIASYDTISNENGCGTFTHPRLTNTGPFSYVFPQYYWSGSECYGCESVEIEVWRFHMTSGLQNVSDKENDYLVWHAHDGDVGAATPPHPSGSSAPACLGWLGWIGRNRHNCYKNI